MIDLETWTDEERQGLFGEIDCGFEVPIQAALAAEAYRDRHGYFPHPGCTNLSLEITRLESPVLTAMDEWPHPEPSFVKYSYDLQVAAAKTIRGKTFVRTRYVGGAPGRKASAWAWVETRP